MPLHNADWTLLALVGMFFILNVLLGELVAPGLTRGLIALAGLAVTCWLASQTRRSQ